MATPSTNQKKDNAAPPATNSSALATSSPMNETLAALLKADAGKGLSHKVEDQVIPNIGLLQPLSPSVLEGPGQIPGAKPGDFLLAGVPASGKEGIFFQMCGMKHEWREFVPREQGGGFRARYPVLRFDAAGEPVPPSGAHRLDDKRYEYAFENGNNCTHYRLIAGVVWNKGVGLEFVLPFKSTGHFIAKKWNSDSSRLLRIGVGASISIAPSWCLIHKLTTSQRRNKSGQWYVVDVGVGAYKIAADLPVDVPLAPSELIGPSWERTYALGQTLHAAFESGEIEASTEEDGGFEPTGNEDPEAM